MKPAVNREIFSRFLAVFTAWFSFCIFSLRSMCFDV